MIYIANMFLDPVEQIVSRMLTKHCPVLIKDGCIVIMKNGFCDLEDRALRRASGFLEAVTGGTARKMMPL